MSFSLPSEAESAQEPVIILRGFVLTAAEEQKKWAQEALQAVEMKAALMQDAIDKEKGLQVVAKAAALMLDELRTNLLEPQNYYELYMKVFAVMETFVQYLEDVYRAGKHTLEDIYEQMQFCGYIVPRLYLLIAAGAVYIKVGEQPALEIMRDLVEMCKGVQHPTRGLFLRHFLLTMMKGKLPGDPNRPASTPRDDTTTNNNKDGGTVTDTANLLIQNFKEMNWLWIRMEAGSYVNRNGGSTNSVSTNTVSISGGAAPPSPTTRQTSSSANSSLSSPNRRVASPSANSPRSPINNNNNNSQQQQQQRSLRMAQRTQQERRAMCVLVGMNLVRISQLDGITRDVYVNTLLPQLLSIMVRYCEPLAQQYLFEVLIQVFPDEFHLFTIDKLFDAISRTVHGVDVPALLRTLMERLCKYAMDVQDGVTDVSSPEEEAQLRDLFPMLLSRLASMPVSYRAQMNPVNVIKRTSAVPPPTPMLLGAYVQTLRHLVNVALTLYGNSVKRRTMALSNIIDVAAEKFSAASAAAAEAANNNNNNNQLTRTSSPGSSSTTAAPTAGTKPTNAREKKRKGDANDDDEAANTDDTNNSANAAAAAAKKAQSAARKGGSPSNTSAAVALGISPAAALAASHFLVYVITECCATVEEVLAMEGVSTLASCLPFLERRDVAMAVCETALRGSTAAPLLPTISKNFLNSAIGKAAGNSSGGGAAAAATVLKPPTVVAAVPLRARSLTALEDVARLFELLDPLLIDQPDTPTDPQLIYKYNPAVEFADEQTCVCRVLHLLANDDPAVYVKMLTGVRKLLQMGGARRIPLTYPTLIALYRRAALRLHAQYVLTVSGQSKAGEAKKSKKAKKDGDVGDDGNTAAAGGEEGAEDKKEGQEEGLEEDALAATTATYTKNVRKCLSHLYSGDSKSVLEVYAVEKPLLALSEYVACALAADVCEEAEVSYALFAEALTLYDTHVVDTTEQVNALVSFVNALAQFKSMSEENYEVLAAKVCQYASKLLKKEDQSRLIAVCATLFAKKHLSQENQQRVAECLRRALKLAGQVLALPQLQLYVQLLNVFLHFYTSKMGYVVSVELINELVEKINEASEAQRVAMGPEPNENNNSKNADSDDDEDQKQETPAGAASTKVDAAAAETFANIRLVYRNITKYIRSRQSAEESWGAIEV